MPKLVLKTARAKAGGSHKNPVCDFIAFWCLPTQYASGKWVRLPPLTQGASQRSLRESCSTINGKMVCILQEIFSQKKFDLGLNVPLWHRIVWRTRQRMGGIRGCSLLVAYRLTIVQLWRRTQPTLGATLRSSHLSVKTTTHAINIAVKVPMEGMFIRESKSIQFLICSLSHSEPPADVSSYRLRGSRAPSYWHLDTGFDERPVQQVLVFFLLLNNYIDRNKILGCARDETSDREYLN